MMQFLAGLTVLIGTSVLIASTGLRVGRIFSPFALTLLVLVAIYGFRPLLMSTSEHFSFYAIDIRSGAVGAALVGLLAVCFLCFGYGLSTLTGRRGAADSPSRPIKKSSMQSGAWPVVLAIPMLVLIGWVVITAFYGGGFDYVRRSFDGRSAALAGTYTNVPAIVFALPVVGCLCLAYSRILYERTNPLTRTQAFSYWVVVVLCLVPPSALGNRRFIIPSLVAAVVGAYAKRWSKRISLKALLIAMGGFIILAIFPFVRSAGSRTGRSDLLGAMGEYFDREGVRGVLDGFFLSYDTEMFNYVAYISPRLGEAIPFGLGRGTLLEALLVPIPAAIAPYEKWSDVILERTFGGGCAEIYCPVPSLPGTLLYDFGLPGVVIGMAVIGFLFGRLRRLNPADQQFTKGLVILCVLAFTVVVVRGNPISQLWISVQCFVVVWVVLRLQLKLIGLLDRRPIQSGNVPALSRRS